MIVEGLDGTIRVWAARVYDSTEAMAAAGFPHDGDLCEGDFLTDREHAMRRFSKLGACAMGSGHDCSLVGVTVAMNITAPRYWWQEMLRYHFVEIVSATSTMHSLLKELDGDVTKLFAPDTDYEVITGFMRYVKHKMAEGYADDALLRVVKQALPESYLMSARVVTNYRQLKTIWHQRHDHRLAEWREFCRWIERLPLGDMLSCDSPKEAALKEALDKVRELMTENDRLKETVDSFIAGYEAHSKGVDATQHMEDGK